MHTSVQNSKSIRYGSGVLKIDGVNVGALEGAKLDVEYSTLQFKADNAKLPPRRVVTKAVFSASLFEISLDSLSKFDGIGTLSNVAATPVSITNEVLRASGTFADNEVLFFANKNGDGTAVSSVVVKNGTTTLTEGTAYALVVENGRTGIVSLANLTLSGIGLNVSYSYTPNQKKVYTISDIAKALTLMNATFENSNENAKKFLISIPQAFNTANLSLPFASDEKLDEVMKLPIELEAYPDALGRLITIEDEQAA